MFPGPLCSSTLGLGLKTDWVTHLALGSLCTISDRSVQYQLSLYNPSPLCTISALSAQYLRSLCALTALSVHSQLSWYNLSSPSAVSAPSVQFQLSLYSPSSLFTVPALSVQSQFHISFLCIILALSSSLGSLSSISVPLLNLSSLCTISALSA